MATLPLAKWLNKELSELLECEVGDEYSKNILTIETEPEIKEFIGSLLDLSIPRNRKFLDELLLKLKKPAVYPEVTVYVKPDLDENSKSKSNKKEPRNNLENTTSNTSQLKQASNKKNNFSLFSTDHASNKKNNSDRRACECQASKHKLIGNCLNCGRIVCELEGSGPCYFCGNLVCTREEFEKVNRGSHKGDQLKAELMSKTWKGFDLIAEDLNSTNARITANEADAINDEKLRKAVEHKNKLIDFDRTSAKRTQVIDDQSDYFNTNSKWLSQKQKNLLEKKEDELSDKRFNKLNTKEFTFDFAGRKIVDDRTVQSAKNYEKEIEAILSEKAVIQEGSGTVVNQDIGEIKLTFVEEKKNKSSAQSKQAQAKKDVTDESKNKKFNYRLQDQELQEMKDDGMCLSMHQPWASLLVAGIKVHEGRPWYTPYRGRLWIHAASKQPSEVDIKEVEHFYKAFYADKVIQLPSAYPTSCLLGYVDLSDCLSSESYREKFPNGESDSEFVFICSNPRELVAKLPMNVKLDKNIHITAKKTSVIVNEEV